MPRSGKSQSGGAAGGDPPPPFPPPPPPPPLVRQNAGIPAEILNPDKHDKRIGLVEGDDGPSIIVVDLTNRNKAYRERNPGDILPPGEPKTYDILVLDVDTGIYRLQPLPNLPGNPVLNMRIVWQHGREPIMRKLPKKPLEATRGGRKSKRARKSRKSKKSKRARKSKKARKLRKSKIFRKRR